MAAGEEVALLRLMVLEIPALEEMGRLGLLLSQLIFKQ